ncbi:uncharacterized protein PHACADRAFT_186918 [Phanerochaete carnosa HHB-10118-sp]|uniref:F-box domain-containing protein n=1 Tax=Phanerochaete carnosa (strain HHB-10118-sp) TaxID=650164 RepID=K5VN73_PHACS|nr:uncharacterized protein PHACADRAFT_186918 [Phanerochaete carnosa HHB-10118-sp]EKM52888.1 hypothetical protein PHACADRAFT_186918 [Phanerochaete carnosa HHB-10118-sp]
MLLATEADIPPELVRRIALFCVDWDKDLEPTQKRGLAACSLTCRYWAQLLTPLIFRRLVLKSAEDIFQLLAFLSAADDRTPPLREAVKKIELGEDRATTKIPWSHHMVKLHKQLPNVNFQRDMQLTVTGSSGSGDAGMDDTFLLPFHTLPRTLPASWTPINYLTLRGLRIATVKALTDCTKNIATRFLVLDDVTFKNEEMGEIRRRRLRRWSELATISITRCFEHDGIDHQFKLANLLFAGQGCMYANDDALALAEKCLTLLLAHTNNGASRPWFGVNYNFADELYNDAPYHKYGYRARCEETGIEARVELSVPENAQLSTYVAVHLEFLRTKPDSSTPPVKWDELERELPKLVETDKLWFYIQCPTPAVARTVLRPMLKGKILAELCGQQKRVRMLVYDEHDADFVLRLTSAKILSAPRSFTLGGTTVSLNISKRIEWLLRGTERRAYLLSLVLSARAAANHTSSNSDSATASSSAGSSKT